MKICHKSFVVVLLFYTFLLVACESINEPKQENLGIQTPSLPTNMPTQTVISTTIPASNQPATPTLNSTPFSAEVDMGLLFFARYEYYGWFDLMAQDSAHGLIFDNLDEYHKFSSQE
jgi:hypothetical protein